MKTSSGAGSCARTAATASGSAPRCTGMCSAWAIIRPRSSKSAVEQSRLSLMFAENAERTRAAPISSATDRRALPMTWSSIFMLVSALVTVASRFRQHERAISIPIPHPPGGNKARRALELDRGRALDVERVAGWEVELRPRLCLGGADGDQFELAAAVRIAVQLLVGTVERLREPVLNRHGQLEGLSRIAEIGLAL